MQISVNGLWITDFGEDNTKSILFASKRKMKKVPKLNVNYKNIKIKQHSKVTYLSCMLDETMSRESMAPNVINEKTRDLNFFLEKTKIQLQRYAGRHVILLLNVTSIMNRQSGILILPKK